MLDSRTDQVDLERRQCFNVDDRTDQVDLERKAVF